MSQYGQYNAYLTTLDALKTYLQSGGGATYDSTDNAVLKSFIQQASQEIIDRLRRIPLPYTATMLLDADTHISDDYRCLYSSDVEDLLAVTSITNGDSTSVTASEYVLIPGNSYPKHEIRIKENQAISWTYSTTPEQAITVVGIWGYVPHYDLCWSNSGDTVQNATQISASGTSLSVVAGTTFETYQYIQIESETLLITGISSNTLTVKRGVLGTTAAAHANGTAIKQFVHHATIQQATTEYAAYLYKVKDALGQQVQIFEGGASINNGLSGRVLDALDRHKRYSLWPH